MDDDRLLQAIRGYLDECFSRDSPPRVGELAVMLGIQAAVLRRRVKRASGVTVSRYLKEAQIRFACALLGRYSGEEVARRAAFGSRRSFLRAFRRALSQTPDAWRRSTKMSLDSAVNRIDIS